MYIVSGLFNDAAIRAEHVAWNGVTTVNNEFEKVQKKIDLSSQHITQRTEQNQCPGSNLSRTSQIHKQDREVW